MSRAFTLVELMIVVAIVGVLAVVAGTAYRKYMDSNRTSEVMAMLGEFRAKEEAYRAENNAYLSTGATETSFFPALQAAGEPVAKTVVGAPSTWTNNAGTPMLGINPTRAQLYCGYVAIAGAPNAWGAAGVAGKAVLDPTGGGATPPGVAWWYVNASCDNDGNSAVNATWVTASTSTSVVSQNEHK